MSEIKEILGVKTNHPYINEYRETVNNLFTNTNRDVLENFFYYLKRELKNITFGNFASESEVGTVIETVFVELSYALKWQNDATAGGKLSRKSIFLFKNQDDKEFFEKSLIGDETILIEKILLVIEIKSPDIDLRKAEDQFYDVLNQYKRDFGIITNGHTWRFYDKSQIYTGEKKYIEFDFSEILKNKFNDQEGFFLFYYLVRKDRYLSGEIEEEKAERIREQNTIKKTLKEILYANPDDSIVFKIAKNIYEKEFGSNPCIAFKELETILEESIIFVLRIFFIAYIEDKFRDVLETHVVYKDKVSFRHFFYPKLIQENIKYSELLSIFVLLDKGMDNEFMKFPMFNGGLFSESKARHLKNENLLTTEEIKDILTKILFFKEENARDKKYIGYSKIDVKSFGELYEALIEYDLRIAQDTIYRIKVDGNYLIYTENNLPIQYKNTREVITYYSGDIYLTSMSLNRKKSGAFYTPDNLTEFMATSAIEEQLKIKSPFNIKIIDNACGSGHFLIASLNYLTDKVYASIEDFKDVKSEMENEHKLIEAEIRKYGIKNIDDKLILKRMLLKKCIYGVDINPIAVEVTMLSLWINTFIFGTPLSFIEHHIKAGNALIGYMRDEFYHFILKHLPNDASLWLNEKIKNIMKKTEEFLQRLKCINDITKEQIEASKIIYSEYKRYGDKLRRVFSLAKLYELYSIKSLALNKSITFGGSGSYDVAKLIESIMNDDISEYDSEIIKEIEAFHHEYKIFHYGIEFPDAASFEIVIGNPPWKKAKFNESEFFAKYNPDYRKLSILEQNKFKSDTMGSDINTESKTLTSLYGDEKRIVSKLNDIYKNGFKKFSCGGDPNLFRYFVAFNLKLIARGGNLTYLIPSCMWNEHSSQKLRIFLFENYELNYLYQFQNKKRFKDVVSCFKFAIFQISNSGRKTSKFKAKFMIQKDDKIVEEMTEELKFIKKGQNFPYRGLYLSLKDIKDISPVKYIVAEYRSKEEFNLTKKMFKKFNILSEDYINFGEGLHATKHRSYFKECDTREDDNIFLYKGANIHQFNSRYFESEETKGTSQLLWINKQDLKNIVPNWFRYENFKIQYRKIARNTDERTMISALKPRDSYCTYSLYLNYEKPSVSILKKLFIISVFNSLPFDFLIRKFVEINVQKTFLYQCPMPQPTDGEILSNPIYLKLAKNACILTVKNDLNNFSELLDIKDLKFTGEEKEKILTLDFKDGYFQETERDINFIVAFLYSLTPDEFFVLLEDFKVLKKKKGKHYFLNLVEEYARWLKEEKKLFSLF
ncbi:N-6 DNA methylase [Borrelia sp. P9F1]|uniref:Eco57I restriction-modification methylase domain-containing protein n=1 Tax=Borrelia sp. P9F1 TaxID=3058374 RepID=UPI00264817BB|nr:N-6 DNA methylase [Borrelia sp. P9F1]WKC58385.1 N-6 DNA methylase [Borrelia sp. P9F1]